ncbi:MAG TPA: MFS transporter [Dehalococcoidia bacterium]|nr:MFS transporter [Dehalococcoidia bacterium]
MNERGPLEAGRDLAQRAYLQADRVLDEGQRRVVRLFWLFLPESSIARDLRFEHVLVSRFLSDAGQQALAYGALIAVMRRGGSALDAALLGVAALLPAALLGLYGGAVADALPKRVALAAVYNLQALLCFAVPIFIGTDLTAMVLLLFAVNALGQVSGPSESAVLPLIASREQLATAASLVNLASSAGTAFGTALLAPIVVRLFGVTAMLFVSGVLLLLAATRVFDLPTHEERQTPAQLRVPPTRVRSALTWLIREPAVGTMIIVAALAGTANVVIQTLAPRYVQSALHVDPADAVYVFGPSVAGLLAALAAGPSLIRRHGERVAAIAGFSITACTLVLLGMIGPVAGVVDDVNPLRAMDITGFALSERLRTAALLALPLGFGVTLTTTSVQTYLNRRVPHAYQGRAFALQSTLKNGAAIVPLLTLGGAATAFGVERVLLASPFALLGLALGLVMLSARLSGMPPRRGLQVLASFWEEPVEAAAPQPMPG